MTAQSELPRSLTVREQLTALAYRKIGLPNLSVRDDLAELSPLAEAPMVDAFNALIKAIVERDGVQDGTVHWSEVAPGAAGLDRDGQALDAAGMRIEDALDVLVGEA